MQTPLLLLVLSAPVIRAGSRTHTNKTDYTSASPVTESEVEYPLDTFPTDLVQVIYDYYFDPDEFNLHCTIDIIPKNLGQRGSTCAEDFRSLSVTKDEIQIRFASAVQSYSFGYDDLPSLNPKKIQDQTRSKKDNSKHGSLLTTNGDLSLHSKATGKGREHLLTLSKKDAPISRSKATSAPRIAAISQWRQSVAVVCSDNHLCLYVSGCEPSKVDVSACNVKCMTFSAYGANLHLCGESRLYYFIFRTQELVKTDVEYPGAVGLATSDDGNILAVYKDNKILIYRKMPQGQVILYFPIE